MSEKNFTHSLLQHAVRLHKSGDLVEAEKLYEDVLESDPQNGDANHLLGLLMYQKGRLKPAADLISRATRTNPANPFYLNNLGTILDTIKNYPEAEDALQQAIKLKPDYAEAYNNLGIVQKNQGNFVEAVESYRKALAISPGYHQAYYNLGNAYQELSKLDEAIKQYDNALKLRPRYAEALNNKGYALQKKGSLDAAEDILRQALQVNPNYPEAHNNLGITLCFKKKFIEAESSIQQAIELRPHFPEAYCNLGIVYQNDRKLSAALLALQKSIELNPGYPNAYFCRAVALLENAKVEEARRDFQMALTLNPDFTVAHSNLLFIMNYSPVTTQKEIYEKSLQWDRQYTKGGNESSQYDNVRTVERRLKIGYVSGDFRDHSVAFFIEPVLRAHNKKKVEIFCYANVIKRDAVTERLQLLSEHWVDIVGLGSEEIAERIRGDQIDILVDLAGHEARNCLLVFGLKPAPVQVTWLGYPNTTGLKVIDYRLTDAIADPEGHDEPFYSEELFRLPHGFLCYQPDANAPEVVPPPCLENGYITFGSFNNLVKVTPSVVKVWSRILRAVPGSRLLLKARQLGFEETRADYTAMLADEGIDASRLDFFPMTESRNEHLKMYHRVDICLDPFPYNGTTTTCEALWMGVPVVTVTGDRHSGRVGASIMHQAGLDELTAGSTGEYIDVAVRTAEDTESLAAMREIIREELMHSKLLDSTLFTETLEDNYRKMWSTWCEAQEKVSGQEAGRVDCGAPDAEKIDIVIPYIKDEFWGEELRYALRSMEKNFKEEFKVNIIGYCPPWCRNVDHIPYADDLSDPHLAFANSGTKLKIAMERFKRFVWTADDIYFLRPINLEDIKLPRVQYDAYAVSKKEGSYTEFQKVIWATSDKLRELDLTGYFPASHTPKYFESDKLAKVYELFPLEEGNYERSFAYFNLFVPEKSKLVWRTDRISWMSRKDYKRQRDLGTAIFLNHNNSGLSGKVKKRIMEMFPEKSRFEK